METRKKVIKDYIRKIGLMFIIGVLSFGVIYGFELISSQSENIPQQFQAAYKDAAASSKKVISLTNSVNKTIEEINALDQQGKSDQALPLIEQAMERNDEARQEALALAQSLTEIQSMLEAISGSERARVVLEAMQIEAELVSEFQAYTKNIDTFLTSLQKAITSDSFSDRVSVQQKLDSVNDKKQTINSLNQQFLAKLEELNSVN